MPKTRTLLAVHALYWKYVQLPSCLQKYPETKKSLPNPMPFAGCRTLGLKKKAPTNVNPFLHPIGSRRIRAGVGLGTQHPTYPREVGQGLCPGPPRGIQPRADDVGVSLCQWQELWLCWEVPGQLPMLVSSSSNCLASGASRRAQVLISRA